MLLGTPPVEPGWTAISFELPDPDGNVHRLEQLRGERGLLIAFICNHCPYVVAIAERFSADARQLQAQGIGVVAINPNDFSNYPADSPPRMKTFAQRYDFSFPYLVDETQEIARAYDAVCTPDFFGLDASDTLRYRGRLDDARMGDASNRVPELLNAMQEIAATGHGPEVQHASMGCSVKWR